ncbi:LacI family DNA-binding transcriptional regulator [Propionibacteriaceae bacterium Y2011]
MVTQRQVAERAGVSARTVSNVVNGFAWVAADTRHRVQAAIEELGYRPNLLARGLQRGRSGLIALVLPLDGPYFVELAGHVVTAAEERGYTVLIDRTDGDARRERDLVSRADRASLFDGIIFSPLGLSDAELRLPVGSPIVLLGEKSSGPAHDRVVVDDVAASHAMTTHLLESGRTRIAAIGQPPRPAGRTGQHRTLGYRRALAAAGMSYDPDLVLPIDAFQRADGAAAVDRLLQRQGTPPDALLAYNDALALGAMYAIRRHGLRVPTDIAVSGFDDIEEGRFVTPTLTTIAPDKQQVAREAVDLVVRRIEGYDGPPTIRRAEWRLIPRESTATPTADAAPTH